MPIRTPQNTVVSNDDPGVAQQVSKSLQYAAEINSGPDEITALASATVYDEAVAVPTGEKTVTVSQADPDQVVAVYNTDKDIYVNNFGQIYSQIYTPINEGGGVSQILAGDNITITSTGAGGTGAVTINSIGGSTNPFNQDLNTFDAVEFTGLTNVQQPIINSADASIANGAKIAVEHDTGESVKQDQMLGSYVFGGSYNSVGGMTYTASIAGYAESDWTSEIAAPTGLVIRTGSIGSSITANPTPNYDSWVADYGDLSADVNDDYGSSVAVDSVGNCYMIGADGNNGYVRFLAKFNNVGGLVWQKRLSDPPSFSYYSSADAICVDSSDNVITAVNADDSVQNTTVMKLDSSGSLLWQQTIQDFETSETQSTTIDLTTDSAGNIYGCGSIYYDPESQRRSFLYKLNSAGAVQWQRRISSPSIGSTLYGIVCDSSGNVYVVGQTYMIGSIMTDQYLQKIYVAKYNSAGVQLWQKIISRNDGSSETNGFGITLDSSNNIIIVARMNSSFTTPVTSSVAGVLLKLNSDGIIQWQRIAPSIRGFYGVSCDAEDNIYTLSNIYVENPNFNSDLITTKFNSSGIMQWQRTLGTAGDEYVWYYWGVKNIAVSDNYYYSTGYFYYNTNNASVVVSRLKTDGSDIDSYGPFSYSASNVLDVAGDCVDEFITPATLNVTMPTVTGEYIVEPNDYTYTRYYKNGNIVSFGNDVVYITSDKKVGIGIKPTEQLTVAGGAKIGSINIGTTSSGSMYVGGKIPDMPSTYNNIALGFYNFTSLTTGFNNIAIGTSAMEYVTSGLFNVGIGTSSVQRLTTGTYNVGVGFAALSNTTTGNSNVGIGGWTLVNNTTGYGNIGLGQNALQQNFTGWNNIAIGTNALLNSGASAGNFAAGVGALFRPSTAGACYDNVAIGYNTLYDNTDGNHNVALGFEVMKSNTTGGSNFAAIYRTLYFNTTGVHNVGIGQETLRYNTTGFQNVALCVGALYNNTTGYNNIALGWNALVSNTTAWDNIAIGATSLRDCTTGIENIAIGSRALGGANVTGYRNIAVGIYPLYRNTTGYGNIALGIAALEYNTTGHNSIAIGEFSLQNNRSNQIIGIGNNALSQNTFGTNNIALGPAALQYNTLGSNNIAVGYAASIFNVTGQNNISYGNFALENNTASQNVAIGNESLRYNSTGSQNVGLGNASLRSNTSGSNNIGIGDQSLRSNTTGLSNIGIGTDSLRGNTTGEHNIGIGVQSLFSNTTGLWNTAVGSISLRNNVSGGSNTAFGYGSLNANTSGNWNTAVGVSALLLNTTGFGNTATGDSALNKNTTGSNNTSSGQQSLLENTTGTGNSAFGRSALRNTTTGNNNTGAGFSAGSNVTTGSNNVFVGNAAGTDAVANITTQSNYVVLGNNSTTNANIKVSWTVTSDARDKGNIVDLAPGLNFINSLRPKQFNLIDRATGQATTGLRYGFLAQDILEREDQTPVLVDNTDHENLKLREAMLVPILTKAVQELSQQIEELKRQIEELKNANISK